MEAGLICKKENPLYGEIVVTAFQGLNWTKPRVKAPLEAPRYIGSRGLRKHV